MANFDITYPIISPQTIILEDFDFGFTRDEINRAAILYNRGYTLREIAKETRPHKSEQTQLVETALLVMHLDLCKKIEVKNRSKNFWG